MSSKKDRPLNEKQRKFCAEYMIDMNGKQAAIRAGYSEKAATSTASDLLTYANVQNYMAELREQQQKRTNVTADMVINELAKMAFGNVRNIFDENDKLKSITQMDVDVSATISEVRTERRMFGDDPIEITRVKVHDKKGSLELLGRHLGLFIDRVKHEGEMIINVRRKVIQATPKDISNRVQPQTPSINKK